MDGGILSGMWTFKKSHYKLYLPIIELHRGPFQITHKQVRMIPEFYYGIDREEYDRVVCLWFV